MKISSWCSSILFVLWLLAIYAAPMKVGPLFFVLFAISAALPLLPVSLRHLFAQRGQRAWYGILVYLIYVIVIYAVKGGDDDVALRLLIDISLFLLATTYFAFISLDHDCEGIRNIISYGLLLALCFSCCQTLYSVAAGNLWLLPLHVKNSVDAYAIETSATIVFGDHNKNIWASKTLFTYLAFFAIRNERWKNLDYAALTVFLVALAYLCSRTAQLAFICGAVAYALYRLRPRLNVTAKIALAICLIAAGFAVLHLMRLTTVSSIDLTEGAHGDGLFARFFLWGYFFSWLPTFHLSELWFGHGVFAVASFLNPPFTETNLHNVFLDQVYDYGIVGCLLYSSFLVFVFRTLSPRWRWLILPALLVVLNSQYLGHEPELLSLYAFSALFAKSSPASARSTIRPTMHGSLSGAH